MELISEYREATFSPITFTEKLNKAMKDQGRTRRWLAGFIGVSRQTLYNRLADNFFTEEEKTKLKNELGIS